MVTKYEKETKEYASKTYARHTGDFSWVAREFYKGRDDVYSGSYYRRLEAKDGILEHWGNVEYVRTTEGVIRNNQCSVGPGMSGYGHPYIGEELGDLPLDTMVRAFPELSGNLTKIVRFKDNGRNKDGDSIGYNFWCNGIKYAYSYGDLPHNIRGSYNKYERRGKNGNFIIQVKTYSGWDTVNKEFTTMKDYNDYMNKVAKHRDGTTKARRDAMRPIMTPEEMMRDLDMIFVEPGSIPTPKEQIRDIIPAHWYKDPITDKSDYDKWVEDEPLFNDDGTPKFHWQEARLFDGQRNHNIPRVLRGTNQILIPNGEEIIVQQVRKPSKYDGKQALLDSDEPIDAMVPDTTSPAKTYKVLMTREVESWRRNNNEREVQFVCLIGRDETGQLWLHTVHPFPYLTASIEKCEMRILDALPGDTIVTASNPLLMTPAMRRTK